MSKNQYYAGVSVKHALSLMNYRERAQCRGKPPGACFPNYLWGIVIREEHCLGDGRILVTARYEALR